MNTNKLNNLPSRCPSCGSALIVDRMACTSCSTVVQGSFALSVIAQLNSEDQQLVLNFIKTSGNLKELAANYHISYPTIRNRIDDLSQKLIELEATLVNSPEKGGGENE